MTETVFGLDTSADDAARLMNRFVRNDWIDIEPALYTGKWFDYRFMNPAQATYLFANIYQRFYRIAYSANIDSEVGQFVKPLGQTDDVFFMPVGTDDKAVKKQRAKKLLISSLWRGRQVADAMGLPYEFYIEMAFHWNLRYWQQKHLPRAQTLYTDLVTDRAAIEWETRQADRLFYSVLPQYKNDRYCDLQSQNAHHEWLFQQLGKRGNPPDVFARLIWEDELLPEDKVAVRLGEDAFARVNERRPNKQRYN